MDDKVQQLLQRAINENLSPDRVSYIMQFNGYDSSVIDAALSELSKKKRPVVFQEQYDSSDTPSPSQQVGPPSLGGAAAPETTFDLQVEDPIEFDQGTGGMSSDKYKDDVYVSTSDWWGNAWNGLVEGVEDFMYSFAKETGSTKEQIAEFVELSEEKYPDLYKKYQLNLQSEDLAAVAESLGYDQDRMNSEAASQAYSDFWQTNPDIENEVVPFIRQRRREKGVDESGVKIDQAVKEKLDEEFLAGAVKGLAGSIPAMVTAGTTMGGSFMVSSYYAADENLKTIFAENPDLEMSKGQQEAYKLTVAGIEAVLEKIGLSGALKGTSMVKRALSAKVFSRLAGMSEDVGSEAFERIVRQEAKGIKGYLKKTAQGTLSEAETGALQQLSNDLINNTVNSLSGEEVFTPKDAMTIIKDALYAGAQEAVGGGIISGSVGSFSNDIATQEDFDAAEEFIGRVEINKLEDNLNKRVTEGKITEEEKSNILNTAKEFKETLAKVPEDVDQESKRSIYQLINKKMQIQKKSAGKDEAIQNKAKEQVEGINEQIASIYETQTKKQAEPVAPKEGTTEAATATEVSPETEVETRFFAPIIETDDSGNAVVDPGKVKEETFTGASVVSKGHVDEDTAFGINSALSLLGDKAKDMKVRVFDSVESLLNADPAAANFYVKNKKMPKAYIKGSEMFVLTKNAVEQYNKAKGTNVDYSKQYIHEVGHPIVSSLVAEDPEVQDRLYTEIEKAAAEGDVIAQRALGFGKNYTSQGEGKVKNETLVEFMALVTDEKKFKSLNRSTKQKIKDFFNTLLSSISSDVVIKTDAELYDVARSMRDAFRMQKAINIQPSTNKKYQQRSAEFSVDEGTTPGNRLFNEPLAEATTIAESYAESKGIQYNPGKIVNTLNTELAQEVAAAYDSMEHNPKDPDVKKAYEALVKETAEQYDAIVAAGFDIEINNNEPYSSSKDMIEDLRSNTRMKIFSTESGFGSEQITDNQRADNPLLRDSGYTDVNGKPLLMNDIFRFVHDFFGHSKRGNGFGPKGEENAWDVHSRMYTSLARRAMTSETRGQNSWVNFSGVNEEAFKVRDKARRLRKEGRTEEAAGLISQVYEMMSFAEQKIGLMPDEYIRNPYIEGGDLDFSLDENFVVSDVVNTEVETKGDPNLDDISFSLDEKVKRHKGRGKIVRAKLKDFVGKKMHVTFSDRMLGGFVDGKEYLGGVYFPFITNSVWGANSVGAANKIVKAAVKNEDGYRYVVIGMMNPDSHMSNKNMSSKALEELEKELNSSRVSVDDAYARIMKAFDRKALNEKYGEIAEKYKSKRKTKANLIKLIDETLLSNEATFDQRRMFLESVLGKADKNLKLRFGNLPSYGTLAQLLAEPVTRGMKAGETSFIIRTKGDLFVAEPKKGEPDYHPSYNKIIRSTEDVDLVFLDGIYDAVEMFPRIEAKNLGHTEYKAKYGDNWRMRYLMYMGLGKMATTVSDEMVEVEAKAAIDFSTDEGVNWYSSPEGKGDPAISRRDDQLEEAAQDLKAGRIKNYEFREMAKGLSPIESITRFFEPATTERMEAALATSKKSSLNKPVKDGEIVALRLDIPAYTGSNTWVVSLHDGKKREGKVISYRSVARITDVVFKSKPLAALNIASGEAKSTIGRMFGKYKNLKGSTPEAMAEDAKAIVSKIWSNPDWKQIGMNPTRASYFYDRKSGRPVVSAEEVVQVGGLVYAKKPVFTRWNDPAFEVKGYSDVDGAPIYFSTDEGTGNINNLRNTLKRTINSKPVSQFLDSRKRILDNPEAYYTKQSLKAIKDNLGLMTEEELLENMTVEGLNRVSNSAGPGKGENDISVLAAVELINRKAEAGEDVSELLVDLAKVGTTVGRMLRHFAELKSATPLGIVATIQGALSKVNRIMSQTQSEKLTDIAGRFIKAGSVVKDLRDQIESEYSKETESKLEKATKELDKVTRELNKFTSIIVPKKIMDLLSTTIQGNLLTPISQVTNVGANLFQIATSIPTRGFETLFSKITSKFSGGKSRSFKYSLMAIPYAIKQGGVGVAEAINTIIMGGASADKIVHTGFLPTAAFLAAISDTKFAAMVNKALGKEVIKGDVLAQMANGKIAVSDRLKSLYEGVFGVAPEIMFRFLALGDKPFSRFAEGMEVYQQAAKLGLKGVALKNYVKYPNKKQQREITEAGRRLTFQQDSTIATGFFGATNWLEKQGSVGKAVAFALKITMPYVKTPANIFTETLKFAVPGIGMASALVNFQKKDMSSGASDLAKAATGQILVMVANKLIASGLVSGAFDDEDEDERSLKYLKFPPMSINRSGLSRLLNGEDPEYRDGDVFIRYDKFGIPGMVIGARVTSIKNNLTEAKNQEDGYYIGENDKGLFEPFSKVFDELGVGLGTIQFLNSQSFLTGANSLLSVLSGEADEYDVDKWFENTFRSLSAIPLPNTLSSIHRSVREYMPNIRTNSVEKKFEYILKDRLFDTDRIPIKIDLLGNKIPQTPEGADEWIFNMLDFTKKQKSRDQLVLNEIYRLYELQEQSDVIPGFPQRLKKIPTRHPETGAKVTGWNPEKEEEYRIGLQEIQEVYAQKRTVMLERLFNSNSYQSLENGKKEQKVIELLKNYDRGYNMVKALPGSGMKNLKPPMEWAKMLDKLDNKYFK